MPYLDTDLRTELERKKREAEFKEKMKMKFDEKRQRLAARGLTRVKRTPRKVSQDVNEVDETEDTPRVFTRKPVRSVKLLSKVRGRNVCND